MPLCTFCGHESHEGARTCVACGAVFGQTPHSPAAPDDELRGELASLSAAEPAAEDAGPEPPGRAPSADAASLATLFDPGPLRKTSLQALVMIALSGALSVVSAVAIVLDVADAMDTLDVESLFAPDPVELAGRTDLLSIAELSLLAGALVMIGGWAQQVAANRALLSPGGGRTSRQVLLALVIPGRNVITSGPAVRELWRATSPPGRPRSAASLLVRAWGPVFGLALGLRILVLLWSFIFWPDVATAGEARQVGAILVGARVAWLAALALSAVLVRALTQRQLEQAEALARGT